MVNQAINATEDEYVVRLLIRVKASSETEAVDRFIENLNNFGLRSWLYMAENDRTKELFQVTGTGSEVEKVDPARFVTR